MIAMTEAQTEACAAAAHEANRAYCRSIGDHSQPPWDVAPGWQQASARNGVAGVVRGNSPRESHGAWLEEKMREGWAWGPTKDPEKRLHPCFVPYDALPLEQKAKDGIFVGVVRTMIAAYEAAAGG